MRSMAEIDYQWPERDTEKGPRQADNVHNQAFRLLADQQSRYALVTLRNMPLETISLLDLADRLLAVDPGADNLYWVKLELHHETLPRLDDAGVIEFDPRTGDVCYRGNDAINDLLDSVFDNG